MQFQNKTAIIVGGGSGIGAATAIAAGKEGASVVVADISEENTNAVVQRIRNSGGQAIPVLIDATKIEDARRLTEVAIESFGRIDYLCYSAGLQTYGTVESTDEATWDKTLDVNLKGMFLVAKYVMPEIKKQGKGAVVNISSVQGLQCQRNVAAYATSKGGAIALTRAMAMDYAADNIRVNCICPGSIDTPLLRYGAAQHGPLDEVLDEWGKNHPIGRIGLPEEIAQTVLFLWSDAAGFILAQPIVVDGGLISGIL